MRSFTYLLTFIVGVLLCCHAIAQDADDAKLLQGAWEISELIVGGKKIPEKEIKGLRFVFEKDKLTIVPAPSDNGVVEKRAFSFKLDAKAKPAGVALTALDGENKGAVSPGIYEIKGDILRWCQSDDPKAKDRPKDFASPEKSAFYLFTFKRTK
jgi:uncharacterized protein (TIGR03067 family)